MNEATSVEGGKGEESNSPIEASIDTRVTESNDMWQRWSWQVTARNVTSEDQVFAVEVQWLDGSGFVVDDDREYGLSLQAGEERTFTGYQLIRQPGSTTVATAKVIVKVPR